METKTIDQNELVQLLPRQFSAIDFVQLVGDQAAFSPDQVADVKRQAEMMALPGKVALWDAVETACGLLAAKQHEAHSVLPDLHVPRDGIA